MARQERKISSTHIYHILLRGINKQRIFEQAEDYIQFLDYLHEVRKISGLTLYAYCLMNNHVHLLVKEGTEPLSIVFRRLGTRYVNWFNRKYDRSGHLFQDRFRSEPVETDDYFLSVLVYIFQNPVKAGLCGTPVDYEWSSRRFLERDSGMFDLQELVAIAPIDIIKQRERESNNLTLLEPMARLRLVYSDKEVALMMFGFGGVRDTSGFQKLTEGAQQTLVAKLRGEKVPIRQISRVTGISKGVLERWGRM
jgi:REP element-mobilizing transposase RayT